MEQSDVKTLIHELVDVQNKILKITFLVKQIDGKLKDVTLSEIHKIIVKLHERQKAIFCELRQEGVFY